MAATLENDFSFQRLQQLNSMRKAGCLTDVILVCGQIEFPAHKVILAVSCQYFRETFTSECEECDSERIEFATIGAEEMEVILQYFYMEKIKEVKDISLLKKLLFACHVLQVKVLFQWCYKRLIAGLGSSDFLEMFRLAQLYNDEEMASCIALYLAKHFNEMVETDEFLNLNDWQMKKIVLRLDPVEVRMDKVIKELLRWTEAKSNCEDKESTLLQIVKNLNLRHTATQTLMELLQQRSVVKNSRLLDLLTAEVTSRTLRLSNNRSEQNNKVSMPMITSTISQKTNKPQFLVFGHSDDNRHVLTLFHVLHSEWSKPTVLPFALERDMAMTLFGEYIYVFGGKDESDTIVQFCPTKKSILSYSKLAIPVSCPVVTALHDTIYIVDGQCDTVPNTVQRYIPSTDTCETIAPCLNFYSYPQVVSFAGCLYLLGFGKNDNTVERYDPTSDIWTLQATIPGNVHKCKAAVCGQKLFVTASETTDQYHVYDFFSEEWDTKHLRGGPESVWQMKSALVKDKYMLVVVDYRGVLHLYDVKSGQWVRKSESSVTWPTWLLIP